MKRILFLLLLTVSVYGQNPSRFAKIQITGNANSGTATKVNVQEANGEVNTQTINTGFNKNIGLGGSDIVGANTLLNQYATTPSDWTAQSYVLNSVVFYGGKQWIAKMATVAGDVPSVSSKWEEITFEALANKTVTVDQTIIDGSTNAVSSNAVFDGLALKSNIGHTHVASQITDLSKASVGLGNVDNTSDINKPISTATQTALNGKQNYLDWATPQDYGAIGDGIADDTAALQACLNSNSNVLLYGNYKTTNYLEVFSNQFIFSNNATITRSSTDSAILVALNRENIQIKGSLTLVGNGNFEGTNSGIKMSGVDNFKIDGVVFKNISGVGLWISKGSVAFPRGKGGLISNIQAINCYIGMQFDYGAQGEYHSVVNFNATECNTGANIYAGNISITGGNIVDNTLGIYLGGTLSSNNSHGILNGININHNTLNLKVDGAEFGESIQGCHFYGKIDSNIEIINSKGISFNNCIIDGLVSVMGVGTHVVSNTQIESQTSFTGSKINIIYCFTKDGGMYIGNNYDIKGVNHAVGLGHNDFGNMHIYTDGEFSINKGGTLSLGGTYNSTRNQASFAKIHGKPETSTTGSLDGYMAFEVSNNSTSPYSREVGRFSSNGDFKINNLSGTGDRVVSADVSGNLKISTAPTAPTAPAGTNTNQIATTAFVQAAARPYKVYTALLSQTGTNAPTATVLENTLGGTVVWSRLSAGHYNGTLVSAFPYLNTATFAGGNVGNYTVSTLISYVGTNSIRVATSNGADGILNQTSIEIRVYL